LTYAVVIEAKKCVDFRNIGSNAVLKDVLAAASDLDDLGLRRKLVLICWTKELKWSAVAQTSLPFCTAIPYQSRDRNRKEILEALKNLANRKPK